jgi:tryptophan synthase alpha chain
MKLILYLSLGYPNLAYSKKIAQDYLEGGCDVIEADFPAQNPYLDSPFIQSRMKGALEQETDYSKYMETIEAIHKKHPKANFIILAYEQTILSIGQKHFHDFMARNNFSDLIYVGENKHPDLKAYLMDQGIKISSFVRYHMPEEDLKEAMHTNGFVYLQAKPNEKKHPNYQTLDTMIPYLKRDLGIDRPIYCGVGISKPEDVRMAKKAGADGVFVGSTVLKLHDDPTTMKRVIKELKDAASSS